MDQDLVPWFRENWNVNVVLDEFPYWQYKGDDHPDVQEYADLMNGEPSDVPTTSSVRQDGPYRTDLVAVDVDPIALRERRTTLGHLESMNTGPKRHRQRKYLRCYNDFLRDGPMDREYYETVHDTYGQSTASRGFAWLKKRGFLVPAPALDKNEGEDETGGVGHAAVQFPLHVDGGVHAVELKRDRMEWDTALDQADRARCYADFRWVAFDQDTADLALRHLDAYRERGVGFLTVHPEDGVEVHLDAEYCTPEVDADLLSRWVVERWDLNERALARLNAGEETDVGEGADLAVDLTTDADPDDRVVVRAREGAETVDRNATPREVPNDQADLTAFGGEGDD